MLLTALITVLANWSDDRTLLNKLLSLPYLPPYTSIPTWQHALHPPSTHYHNLALSTPAHPLHLILGTPIHIRVCYFEHCLA